MTATMAAPRTAEPIFVVDHHTSLRNHKVGVWLVVRGEGLLLQSTFSRRRPEPMLGIQSDFILTSVITECPCYQTYLVTVASC